MRLPDEFARLSVDDIDGEAHESHFLAVAIFSLIGLLVSFLVLFEVAEIPAILATF